METQANAPAPAQEQTPVHPIHEEEALIGRLTKFVQDTPDNDPHAGTDLEAPKEDAPEKPAEAPAEDPPESDESKVEIDEDTPIFDLEYKTENGKEQKKLSLKELREGWLAKQDYHRNIQRVKAQEAQLQEQVRNAELQAQQKYVQELDKYKQLVVKTAAPELAGIDLNKIAAEDPARAQQLFFKQIQLNQILQGIEAEQRQAVEKLNNERQAALAKQIEESRTVLSSDIKGWNDELYGNVLKTVTQEYGLPAGDVAQVVDARLIKVFHDAHQYRQLQKAKPAIEKKVVTVPKVVRPGSAEKPSPAAEAVEEARKRVKKTGDWRDAAEWYLATKKTSKRS